MYCVGVLVVCVVCVVGFGDEFGVGVEVMGVLVYYVLG